MTQTEKHKHYELILAVAEKRPLDIIATGAWERVPLEDSLSVLLKAIEGCYINCIRIAPRLLKITIGDQTYEVPAPPTTKPIKGQKIFVVDPLEKLGYVNETWAGSSSNEAWFGWGLVYLDHESAALRGKAGRLKTFGE